MPSRRSLRSAAAMQARDACRAKHAHGAPLPYVLEPDRLPYPHEVYSRSDHSVPAARLLSSSPARTHRHKSFGLSEPTPVQALPALVEIRPPKRAFFSCVVAGARPALRTANGKCRLMYLKVPIKRPDYKNPGKSRILGTPCMKTGADCL
jgi:hypothetical protein